jgi:NAD(P)-dependent dehydrogenase (short-subunit alcohol dehydrogenase family)
VSLAETVPGRLAGRVALVTGASRGIGAAVARRFAAEGAHLVLVARTVGGLEAVDDAVRAGGGTATLLPLDLTEFDKIDQMAAAIWQRFGRLDIVVGNAGILGELGPLGHLDPKLFQRMIDLHVTANWRLIRACDPLLRQAPAGRALFTSCAAGRAATAYWSGYAVTKAALEMMVRVYAAELGLTRVKAVLVDPGPVATALRKAAFPGEDRATLPGPDEVAQLFLDAVLA